jgi:regulator of replication initiation timing
MMNNEAASEKIGICTIAAKNYLPQARALMHSVKKQHPSFRRFVLLADKIDGYFEPEAEDFCLDISSNLAIPQNSLFHFKYSILELCTAVKPYYLEDLFVRHNLDKLIYLDPDILLFDQLEPVLEALSRSSIVLTPHLTGRLADNQAGSELLVRQHGVYNVGFIALSRYEESAGFLKWWQAKLYNDCITDLEQGIFVDQSWLDLAPGLFEGVEVLRDPGLNVAWWNLPQRQVEQREDCYYVNGQPLRFYHFSGYRADSPEDDPAANSVYKIRCTPEQISQVHDLLNFYKQVMLEQGYATCKSWPYVYGYFSNGEPIPAICRRMVRDDIEFQASLANIPEAEQEAQIINYLNASFDEAGPDRALISRLVYRIYSQRLDVQITYPDIKDKDRLGVARWFVELAAKSYNLDSRFVDPVARTIGGEAQLRLTAFEQLSRETVRLSQEIIRLGQENSRLGQEISRLDLESSGLQEALRQRQEISVNLHTENSLLKQQYSQLDGLYNEQQQYCKELEVRTRQLEQWSKELEAGLLHYQNSKLHRILSRLAGFQKKK